jgi:hypothetical protein
MNKRRKFLGYLTFAALLPFLPARRTAASHLAGGAHPSAIRILLDLLPDNPATHYLGARAIQHFRRTEPAGIVAENLLDTLTATPTPTTHQLRFHLRSLCDEDFAAGDTVTLDGWIMARSEAEAIALVTLYRTG